MQAIPYDRPIAPLLVRNGLFSCLPKHIEQIAVLCIGSNRINGDSLGPFVGTLLNGLYPEHLQIIGNLKQPIDATNLEATIQNLSLPPHTWLLAVDSIIGKADYVHHIVVRQGNMRPGSALGKQFPAVGDASIMGVVLEEGDVISNTLPYTNLHVVYEMARAIATGIALTARQYFNCDRNERIMLFS